jgi:hypothetical protein
MRKCPLGDGSSKWKPGSQLNQSKRRLIRTEASQVDMSWSGKLTNSKNRKPKTRTPF